MADNGIALMAHLMRPRRIRSDTEELETRAARGYEATVEELLNPEEQDAIDIRDLLRYHPWAWKSGTIQGMGATKWLYHMINTRRPLEEKMVLFWHQIFATGVSKVDHYDEIDDMLDLFREKGMGNYRDLLLEVAKNPAMIHWLDNNENHAEAVNENWGRELLELFSMGVGNYTEVDVRECSRAFTGWTMSPKLPRFPMGRFDWYFEYKEEDHDDTEKTFLGHTGRFNGEDIIRIICEQPATARFVRPAPVQLLRGRRGPGARVVGDASQGPGGHRDSGECLHRVWVRHEVGACVCCSTRTSSRKPRFARLKSPAEVVIGTLRLVGGR